MKRSFAEILRTACKANGLGTSGASSALLARLRKLDKKKNTKKTMPKKKKANKALTSKSKIKNTCKGGVCKPTKTSPIKIQKEGVRLSASYYYHEMCGGKLKNCKPQIIQEPSGRHRLKQIKIVDGAHGKHPRWVLVE